MTSSSSYVYALQVLGAKIRNYVTVRPPIPNPVPKADGLTDLYQPLPSFDRIRNLSLLPL